MNLFSVSSSKIWVAVIIFISFLGANSFAYADTETKVLTFNEALGFALSHPKIQGKRQELDVANEKLNTSKWLRYPSLTVLSSAGQASIGSRDRTATTTVRLEQPLWAGGRISSSIESSQARLQSSMFGLSEMEQDVLGRTSAAYANLLKFQDKIESSNENVAEHKRLLELIQRKARSEVSPMVEIILAKTRLEQAQYENTQLMTQATNFKADLQALTGQSFKAIQNPKVALSLPNNLDEAISLTISNSPTIKRLESDASAFRADIDVAKASLWPQISARSEQIFGGITEGNISYLALTYAPGNGLSSISAKNEASAKKDVAETLIRSSALDLSNRVRSDWNEYQAESKQIEVLTNLVQTTHGIYESYLRQYSVGKKTWIEVLNAKKEATQSKYLLAESDWNSFMAGVRLQISTGLIMQDSPNLK
jgi:adhesin transport system outer membrane protein